MTHKTPSSATMITPYGVRFSIWGTGEELSFSARPRRLCRREAPDTFRGPKGEGHAKSRGGFLTAGSMGSPLQHGVRADGPVLQHAEAWHLHHEHAATLGAQVERLGGGVWQDHGDLCGAGGSPAEGNSYP